MSKFMNKLGVAICALVLSASVTACGNNDDNNDGNNGDNNGACAAGEVLAQNGSDATPQCYKDCTASPAVCSDTQMCKASAGNPSICVAKPADDCPTGEKKVQLEGDTEPKCYVDCAADGSICGANEECTPRSGSRVCGPKPPAECDEGEVEAVLNGGTAQCYTDCSNGEACGNGELCADSDTAGVRVCGPAPFDAAQFCQLACSVLTGNCAADTCDGLTPEQTMALTQAEAACVANANFEGSGQSCEQLAQDANVRTAILEALGNGQQFSCGASSRRTLCEDASLTDACGCGVPTYGACATDADCGDQTLPTGCFTEAETELPGGQCQAFGCAEGISLDGMNPISIADFGGRRTITVNLGDQAVALGCGEGDSCRVIADENVTMIVGSICVQSCTQNSDCARGVAPGSTDSGYACSAGFALDQNGDVVVSGGSCVPACDEDADCGQGGICGDDRVCEQSCMDDSMCTVSDGVMDYPVAGLTCTPLARDATVSSCSLTQPYSN